MPMYRVRTVWTGVAGSPYYSNHYFTQEGGTAVQARAAVQAFLVGIDDQLRSTLSYTIETDVPIVDETTGDVISVQPGGTPFNATGGQAGTPLPEANQFLIRLRTGVFVGGREIRGRMFVPGATTATMLDGGPNLDVRTVLGAAAAALVSAENAQWVVYAKSKNTYAVINSASVWGEYAVLRSRRD